MARCRRRRANANCGIRLSHESQTFLDTGLDVVADISKLISVVQIENVRLVEAHLRASVSTPPDDGDTETEMKLGRKAVVVDDVKDGHFNVRADFVFKLVSQAKDGSEAENEQPLVEISACLELGYRLPPDAQFSKEELSEFGNVNAVFNAWPYWREFIQSSISRMGLPPVVLPVFRLPKKKPKSEEPKAETEKTDASKIH